MIDIIKPDSVKIYEFRTIDRYKMFDMTFPEIQPGEKVLLEAPIESDGCMLSDFRCYCESDNYSLYLNELPSILIGYYTVLYYKEITSKIILDDNLNVFTINREPYQVNSRTYSKPKESRYIYFVNDGSQSTDLFHISITYQELDGGRREVRRDL